MKKISYIYVLFAAVLWGSMGVFVNKMNEFGFNSLQMVFMRAVVSVIFLVVYIFCKDKKLFKIHIKDVWIFIGSGVVSFTFFSCCYFNAMQLCSLSIASVLLYTAPIFVMIFSYFLFKEKFSISKVFAVVLTFAGCCFVAGVSLNGMSISLLGLLSGLGAGIGYALYSIFGRYGVAKYNTLTVTFYTFLFASVSMLPFSDVGFIAQKITIPEIAIWVVVMGFVTSVLPYLSYTKGLSLIESGKASIIASIEPVVATLISVFYFGEIMTVYKIIGICMVLAAVVIVGITELKRDA